jgi:hypothetical protein
MNSIADLKKFMLRVLTAAGGLPLPEEHLFRVTSEAFTPRPLKSDLSDARRELEDAGFIQGAKDDLDEKVTTWTLTAKGVHKAKTLG